MDGKEEATPDAERDDLEQSILLREAVEGWISRFWRERLEDVPSAIARHATLDVVFRIIGGPSDLPGPWHFEGHAAVIEAVKTIDAALEFLSFDIADLIIDGDKLALRWHATLRNRQTGVIGNLAVFDLITLRDGLFCRYEEFLDTDGFRRLMTGQPQPALARRANRPRRGLQDILRELRMNRTPLMPRAERDAREQFLRKVWADRFARGSVALPDYWARECEMHIIGDPMSVPFARSHYGMDAVRALVDQIDIEFEFLSVVVKDVLVDGERAAMRVVSEAKHRGTGVTGTIEAFNHVAFEGDRIVSVIYFFDTAAVARSVAGG